MFMSKRGLCSVLFFSMTMFCFLFLSVFCLDGYLMFSFLAVHFSLNFHIPVLLLVILIPRCEYWNFLGCWLRFRKGFGLVIL